MSDVTSIQWADSTVNPIMGCGGCELFPPPAQVLLAINQAVATTGHTISSRAMYEELVKMNYQSLDSPLEGQKNAVNMTNIWHLRREFRSSVLDHTNLDFAAADAAEKAIEKSITCYAAKLHLNKGQNILKQEYKGHPGYAPIFESVTEFPGRATKSAKLRDLLGYSEDRSPWKANLPRLIFVSDMGDAMSGLGQFPFLKNDLIPATTSDAGKLHLWLWLTKRPSRLAEFAEQIGGLPDNVCAMTTLTSGSESNMKRLADLKKVRAHIRGLSIEPLWERIDPKKLDLNGIDWVIVGGESGSGKHTRPFPLEWAEELRDHCRKKRVAFFMKQLGRNPSRNGVVFKLRDGHGGNWDEWPDEALKVREFPKAFHQYRKKEMKRSNKPSTSKKGKNDIQHAPPSKEEKAEFQRLHGIVSNGVKAFVEAGEALQKIQDGKLWRAGDFKTWDDYCRSVAGMSRNHAHRLIQASQCVIELRSVSDFTILPNSESQVRALLRLKDNEKIRSVWDAAVDQAGNAQPTAAEVSGMVDSILVTNDDGHIIKQKPLTKSQKQREILSKLRGVISQKESWDEAERLLEEMEKFV